MVETGGIYSRLVTPKGQNDYDALLSTGLYAALTKQNLLLPHDEVDHIEGLPSGSDHYKILRPEQIAFISYPYEWSFSQLKDAALLTLAAQNTALDHGIILKDASAYNVQFRGGKPILIDTLSFEPYSGQSTWSAYRQFCQHFLAPLALMAYVDPKLNIMLRDFIDGIPLDLAVKLLPLRRRVKGNLMLHLVLHAAAQRRKANAPKSSTITGGPAKETNLRNLRGLTESLERAVKKLSLSAKLTSVWGQYYSFTNYSNKAFEHKQQLVAGHIKKIKPQTVWDMGGNDGTFSRVAAEAGAGEVVCFDIDPLAVEYGYRQVRQEKLKNILPLRLDLTNPSPALGWANRERSSLADRAASTNIVLALALIHHLAIANNLPFALIAEYFSELGEHLIVEFIPKTDSKVQTLLSSRPDIFEHYTQEGFEQAFAKYYKIVQHDGIAGSMRELYLMRRRG